MEEREKGGREDKKGINEMKSEKEDITVIWQRF